MRILIIDDELLIVKAVSAILSHAGHMPLPLAQANAA
jgi:two-component SAPR family response regulator